MKKAAKKLKRKHTKNYKTSALGLGTHLFLEVPRPGDSKGSFAVFESSFHLLLAVLPLKGRGIPLSALPKNTTSELASYLHTILFYAEVKQISCKYCINFFKPFFLTRPGIETRSTDYEVCLNPLPRASFYKKRNHKMSKH